jgi:lipoyl(octanoyl) transferase
VASGLVDYQAALERMEHDVLAIAAGDAPERVWLLEHPPVYLSQTR